MKMISLILCALSFFNITGYAEQSRPATAKGVVFHDENRNGVRDTGEQGLPDIRVSNGQDIVLTDSQGAYRIKIDDDTILFVIKPSGWMTPLDSCKLPRFYYIHKPAGSPKMNYPGIAPTGPLPEDLDFALYKRPEPDRFKVLVLGDSQPDTMEHVQFFAHDIIEQIIGTDAVFSISLGDLVGERLDFFDPLNRITAHLGIPFYNVPGNHDMDMKAPDDQSADDPFQRVYGPSYYAFDYGPVHFIILDDVIMHKRTETEQGRYHAGLGARQLQFVKNDLALVPKDRLVVLSMHIPIHEIRERNELFSILAGHDHTLSFAAHRHNQQHIFLDKGSGQGVSLPHHHITCATSCGSWWKGSTDEVGIPHATMGDGGPNGWSIATFDGQGYSMVFRPARRPADYQMNIFTPEVVALAEVEKTEVVVNVFAGSERSTVEMRVGSTPWIRLKNVRRSDPYFDLLKKAEEEAPPPHKYRLPSGGETPHIWQGMLPAGLKAGTHLIEVRTTDMFDQTYTGRRIFRIE